MPQRIQLSRRKGWRLPPNTVNVARPTKWGNPYKLEHYKVLDENDERLPIDNVHAREMAVRDHEAWLHCMPSGEAIAAAAKVELRGKNLACWCRLDAECHADALLEIANS